MAKRKKSTKKKKKKKQSSFISRVNWKIVIFSALITFLAAAFISAAVYYLLNSSFFEISKVEIIGEGWDSKPQALDESFLGNNIFLMDLEDVKRTIEGDFPRVKKAEVKRILPEKISVEVIMRRPIAVISYAGGIVIDAEAFVIDTDQMPEDLVRIEGLSFFFNLPDVGENVHSAKLDRALLLIKTVRERLPEGINLEEVRILRGDNLELVVDGVPVRMGEERYSQRISRLVEIVSDPRIDLGQIKYIDLRFEDSVIAPK